jgi:Cu2+-exporting ATPase
VFFDKTGTLTQGKFSIASVTMHSVQFSQEQVLQLAAHLELRSEHPIAKAFLPYLAGDEQLEAVELIVGKGLQANWLHNGQCYQVKIGSSAFCEVVNKSPVCITINSTLVASIELIDAIRPEIQSLVAKLQENDISLAIITGDSSNNAEHIAQQLQIAELHKGCSPEDKVAFIQKATAAGETVLMVGDGINDSPCFHAAHVSVALDSGTDLSKNQADVVLLHNNLSLLVSLITGAKQAQRVIKQNLLWAVGYNLVIIPLAVCGFVSPYVAVIGMSTSSLLVVSNSLRLLKT